LYLLLVLSGIYYISCDMYLIICSEHHIGTCVLKGLILIIWTADILFKALCDTNKLSPFP